MSLQTGVSAALTRLAQAINTVAGLIAAPTFTGAVTEGVTTLSGTTPTLSAASGTIAVWTLTGNATPSDGLSAGQYLTLMVADGSAYTITWPSVVWVGGSAPTLPTSGYAVIELWKVGSTLYGAGVGDVA